MKLLWLWRNELTYLAFFVLIALIVSRFTGYFMYMLTIILIAVILRQAFLLSRLERWLSQDARKKIPTASGVWGDIYYHFYRIKKKEKQRKKKLGKIIEQFHKSTDVLPDAAIVIGHHDEIEWSNKLARVVLGITKSDRGQRIDNLIRAPEFVFFLQNRKNKQTLTLASPIDSKIILQYRIVSYGNHQHLLIAHDITQQKKIETMRKDFVGNVSHELRTPITVLKGYLETLQDLDDKQSPLLTRSLAQMSSQTERMQYLVDDLLLLARLETKKMQNECVDIIALINRICSDNGDIEKGSQRIKVNLQSHCKIYGEKKDLSSAFSNLIINALKYSEPNSPVFVNCSKNKDGQMLFEVIDQGEGIAKENISRVTERFYRVDVKRTKKLPGTGLGLAIVKHVLIRHNAKLEIDSEVNKGSRFRCIFPASRLC